MALTPYLDRIFEHSDVWESGGEIRVSGRLRSRPSQPNPDLALEAELARVVREEVAKSTGVKSES